MNKVKIETNGKDIASTTRSYQLTQNAGERPILLIDTVVPKTTVELNGVQIEYFRFQILRDLDETTILRMITDNIVTQNIEQIKFLREYLELRKKGEIK